MTGTITNVVKQFKASWTTLLEPDSILQACHDVVYSWRDRTLGPVVTIQLFLLQILHGNTACSELRHLSKLSISGSAYCQARMRLPLKIFQLLLDRVTGRLQKEQNDDGRWLGHRTLLIDGSSFSMPDELVLQGEFGQPGCQRPGCGFPVAHLLALFHSSTGMILEVLTAPMRTHDMSRAALTHPKLQPNDILVADCGFCSYTHLALLLQRGVHAAMKVHQKMIVDFTPGRQHAHPTKGKNDGKTGLPRSRQIRLIGVADQIVEWFKPAHAPVWIQHAEYRKLTDSIQVRELRYRVEVKGFRSNEVTLVTTLLDGEVYTAGSLAELYFARWQVEVNLGHLKTTMGLDVLKCKTVDGVLKELIIYVLIYNLVRLVMLKAARRQRLPINRISFLDALRWLKHANAGQPLSDLVVNPYRPFRFEPRVVKRRPKQYKHMREPRPMLHKRLPENN
jgi:hypothetical protein